MNRYIPKAIRNQVARCAQNRCEYGSVHGDDSFLPFEIDHIISLKHGGGNEIENLAFACPHCNQKKGSDLTTFLKSYDDIVGLFNPRIHSWSKHFQVEEGEIIPQTRIAEATVKLLKLNEPERIIHRKILMEIDCYP